MYIPPLPLRRLFPIVLTLPLSGCLFGPLREEPIHAEAEPIVAPQPVADPSSVVEPVIAEPMQIDTVPPPKDVWQRIVRGYGIERVDHPRLEQELAWLRAHPTYLLHASERAKPYLHYVVEIAESQDMPLELALLPIVESGFNPRARSRFDAGGLWQFMPKTGQAFGLAQNWWYDGRYDIDASTRAAFDYLKHLAAQFDGDWALALAAYNAGPGTVRKAIARNRKEDLPTHFWNLELPRETSNYIPRLIAVARVIEAPEDYGIRLAHIPNRPQLAQAPVPRQIDLRVAADLAGLGHDELLALNPGHRRWATAPNGPHDLLLPNSRAEAFQTKLQQLDASAWIRTRRHRIRPGDTLGSIARLHGVSVREIQRLNRLRGSRIQAGKQLLIPTGETPPTQARSKKPGLHLVQPGDTLWDIGRQYKLNYKRLAAWNDLAVNDSLRPGQTLRLAPGATKPQSRSVAYRVRSGDSLYVIARRFGVKVADLRRWNRFDGPYLQPGQTLNLYPGADTTSQL